jgi:RecA-family ATPase
MIAAAPSGQGKSSMSFQMAALFAAGREAFGIKPAKPLRVLVIQAEDDEGDCIEMSWVVNHLDLSNEENIESETIRL